MTRAAYSGGAAPRWDAGASVVYRPLAEALVARAGDTLRGRSVLDVGAGTGVASDALARRGARPLAIDLSVDMLRVRPDERPPAAVADTLALPVRAGAVDGVVAAFVLNHLTDPVAGLRELTRVTRPGGLLLADVFATTSQHDGRDAVDAVVTDAGWVAPDWYRALKTSAVPLLGSADAMATAAAAAGLTDTTVDEAPIDVNLVEPRHLVQYRLGQAQFADFVSALSRPAHERLVADAVAAAAAVMTPYRPVVVTLAARTPDRQRRAPRRDGTR